MQPSYSYVELVVIHVVMAVLYIYILMLIIIVGYRWMFDEF